MCVDTLALAGLTGRHVTGPLLPENFMHTQRQISHGRSRPPPRPFKVMKTRMAGLSRFCRVVRFGWKSKFTSWPCLAMLGPTSAWTEQTRRKHLPSTMGKPRSVQLGRMRRVLRHVRFFAHRGSISLILKTQAVRFQTLMIPRTKNGF